MTINKHGLRRKPESRVRRQLRQEAGFGCVICGAAMIEYEHIDPPFTECREHDPACMTILCKACHGNVTSGMWSKEKVWEAKKNPKAKSKGFSHAGLDMGTGIPTVQIGPLTIEDADHILTIGDTPIFSFLPPEETGAPVRFNADVRDANGNQIFQIIENEWQSNAENWDVEQTANRIKIRTGKGEIALEIEFIPRKRVVFKRVNMLTHGLRMIGDDKSFQLNTVDYGQLSVSGGKISSLKHAVLYDPSNGSLTVGVAREGEGNRFSMELKNLHIGGPTNLSLAGKAEPRRKPSKQIAASTKVGRNKKCPCGSDKKYKFCCGRY